MVSSSQSSIKNISIRRTLELAFCKEQAAKSILLRSTLQEPINTINQTRGCLILTLNGTLKGSKASIKWTWRMASRILNMWDLLFWKTGLKWTPTCLKDRQAKEFTSTKTLRTKDSHRSTLEINWTLQTLEKSNSFKLQQLLDLMIIRLRTVESSLETTMWVKSVWDRTRLLRRTY
jgi:hypothetical protein